MYRKMLLHILVILTYRGLLLPAEAAIDKKVIIQPILVENSMPVPDWFEAETDKIWAQAGIDMQFLPLKTITAPASIFITSQEELESFFTLAEGRSDDPTVINVWFTRELALGGIMGTVAGYTHHIGSNLMVIAQYSVANHVVNTLSHELGHALGLNHFNDPPDPYNPMSDYLMSSMLTATYLIDDIYPDGLGNDKLIESQIVQARSSPYIKSLNPYTLQALVVSSGGGFSAGAVYTLHNCLGQPDVTQAAGGIYVMNSGFLAGMAGCRVNLHDLAVFSEQWLSVDVMSAANLDGSGGVDMADFAEFAFWWLDACPAGWNLK